MTGNLFPEFDKVAGAIALLKANEPAQGYYGCFSGGKDSCVIKELAKLAGVKVMWHYNQTTIDPPELVRFIRNEHPDVEWTRPKHGNFFRRMEVKGFPSRVGRWCCEEYKETAPPRGSVLIMGVRAAESPRRAATWKPVTFHSRTKSWCVAPILSWSTADVWAFIRSRSLPYCSLYDEGFERLGCIGCPMARRDGKRKEFDRWPGFERQWKRAFQRLWERRSGSAQRDGRPWFGVVYFRSWEQMWEWWLSNDSLPAPLAERTPLFDADDDPFCLRCGYHPDECQCDDDSCRVAIDMLSQ